MTKSKAIKAMRELADRLEASGLPEEMRFGLSFYIHKIAAEHEKDIQSLTDNPFTPVTMNKDSWLSNGVADPDFHIAAFYERKPAT